MRTLLPAFVALTLCTTMVPSAAAYEEFFSAGVGGVSHDVVDQLDAGAALAVRRAADADGNGHVTDAEAKAWRGGRPPQPVDRDLRERCLASYTMVQADGFRGNDVMFSEGYRDVAGPVDGRPMRHTLLVHVWGGGIDVDEPVTVHFGDRANLVALLRCLGEVESDPFPAGRPTRLEITGGFDSWDIGPSIQPREAAKLRELMGVDNANIPQYRLVADTPDEVNLLYAQPLTYRNALEMQGLKGWIVGNAYVLFGAGGALGALALVVFLTEIGRWKVSALPFFTRIERDEALEHERRDRLYAFIQENPGRSFSDLKRAFDLSSGTLLHHLRVLESQEFVKVHREGFRTRFYLRGPRVTPEPYLSRTQRALLDLVQANPGLTQKQIAHMLGLPRQSVLYHGRKLQVEGKVAVRTEGRWRRYFPAVA